MIDIHTTKPIHQELQPYIHSYWTMKSHGPIAVDSVLMPTCGSDLIINLASPIRYTGVLSPTIHFNGLRRTPMQISQSGMIHIIGITFKASGAYPFNVNSLCKGTHSDTLFNLLELRLSKIVTDISTSSALSEADASIVLSASVPVIEHTLLSFMDDRLLPPPSLLTLLKQLDSTNDLGNISNLNPDFGISHRQIERQFTRYVGMGPKTYASLVRFRRILKDLDDPILRETGIAHLAQVHYFHDQSHLIRDFSKFSDMTPGQYLRRTSKSSLSTDVVYLQSKKPPRD